MTRNPRQKPRSRGRARRIPRSLATLLLGLGMAVADNPARGQGGPSDPNDEQRLQAMMDRITRSLEKADDGLAGTIAMRTDPNYRFDDPARNVLDGTIWAWGRSGRPTALLTLSVQKKEGVLCCLGELTSFLRRGVRADEDSQP